MFICEIDSFSFNFYLASGAAWVASTEIGTFYDISAVSTSKIWHWNVLGGGGGQMFCSSKFGLYLQSP